MGNGVTKRIGSSDLVEERKRRRTGSDPSLAGGTAAKLNRMIDFANTLDDAFELMEGIHQQVEDHNMATLTKAQVELLTKAMKSLSLHQSHHYHHDTHDESEADAFHQFIGEEYALSGGSSTNALRDALLNDMKDTDMEEYLMKSMKSRRESCAYLAANLRPIVATYMNTLNSWSFDVLDMRERAVTENPLVVITMAALATQGLMEGFIVKESTLVEYLTEIEKSYFENPYHNCWHAADVVQATNYGILTSAADVKLPRLAKFSALIAAAVHDVGHIGVNNSFLVMTSHHLALQYSDRSPLEMMHAHKAFSVMHKPDCNILESFSQNDKMAIRKIIISMVLSTDNANHGTLLESFTRMRVSNAMNLDEHPNDQLILLNMILHSMDVSNVARPWLVSRKWLELVTIEFYAQGDAERSEGIAVTPIMDRYTTTPQAKFQSGFITYIVKPLFAELANAGLNVSEPLQCMECNLSSWESIASDKCTLEDVDGKCGYHAPPFIEQIVSADAASRTKGYIQRRASSHYHETSGKSGEEISESTSARTEA